MPFKKSNIFILPVLLLFLTTFNPVFAQPDVREGESIPLLNGVVAPATPAFTILGILPTAISRPISPREFSIALMEATSSLAIVPENFSMELNPYLLFSGQAPMVQDVFRMGPDNKITKSIKAPMFVTNTALSIATSPNLSANLDTLGTGVGIGLRSLVHNDQIDEAELEKVMTEIQRTLDLKSKLTDELANLQILYDQFIREDNKMEADKVWAEIVRKNAELAVVDINKLKLEEARKISQLRYGLKWQVATGLGFDYVGQNIKAGQLTRWGLWSTWEYTFKPRDISKIGRWSLLFTTKYFRTNFLETPGNLDTGFRLHFVHNQFMISGEVLSRLLATEVDGVPSLGNEFVFSGFDRARKVLMMEYEVSPQARISFSFGEDLPMRGQETGKTLIALTGLRFGIGKLYQQKVGEQKSTP